MYRKEDIPSEYHYKWNDRILPLLVEAEEGYNMVQERTEDYTGMMSESCTIRATVTQMGT